ncbi:MAG TPA: phosphoribosylpyrophosphate synthetase [Microscillaceae bacterium]|nr:phosphoribosylpyrophosphate synthetase [Microscillaceae bacterium]
MQDFETLSQAMNALRAEGYVEDFNLQSNSLECRNLNIQVAPNDFKVDHFFRFEGMSDPGDSSILYAISSEKNHLKGLLVNGYGVYTEDTTNDMIAKLKVH